MNPLPNTLFTADNLFILHGLDSGIADLIYLDPPFNTKRTYSAPVGTRAAGSAFKDMWSWADVNEAYLETMLARHPAVGKVIETAQQTHSDDMAAYIAYMAQRLIECHRVLKDTGSLYLHCDPTASHYLKLLLDGVFGRTMFGNEISWKRSQPKSHTTVRFANCRDIILRYTKTPSAFFRPVHGTYNASYVEKFYRYTDKDGRLYRLGDLTNPAKHRPNLTYEFLGVTRVWRWTKKRMQQAYKAGLIVQSEPGAVPRLKRYFDEMPGQPITDNWDDIEHLHGTNAETTGYPTQKPLALMHRIIEASSNEGDLVLDPFCGCATTCVAAQQLRRRWIGIDIEEQAAKILIERLSSDAGLFKDFVHRQDTPRRTDITEEPMTLSVKERLFAQQGGCCNGCGAQFAIQNFEIDHIIPRAAGGQGYYENLQLLCGSCNRIKGDRPMEYLRMRMKTLAAASAQRLFGA